ncbi:MAG TPA: protein-L-isoaspartate O-methyltransferase [Burkholderiaceae bacterium]|nr:protein-L-isoaspartate O-methyltransferase [Burkholderiaceae bacterium]
MNTELARFNMIEQQIRPWDVLDPLVLGTLSAVPRERFCPLAYQALAFVDTEIPLPPRQHPSQIMLAPRVEARLLQDLQPRPTDEVLEVGTGSGYMAALLGRLTHRVISIEMEPQLAAQARENLAAAGIENVAVREGDGLGGAPDRGPFDIIVLSGSVAQIPQALLAQLKIGGRLATIVGAEPMMRATFVVRTGENHYSTMQPWDTVTARLKGFDEATRFSF